MDERQKKLELAGLIPPCYTLKKQGDCTKVNCRGYTGVWRLIEGKFTCLRCSFNCFVSSISNGRLVKAAHYSIGCSKDNHEKHMMPKIPCRIIFPLFNYEIKQYFNFVAEVNLNEPSCKEFLNTRHYLITTTQQHWDILPIKGGKIGSKYGIINSPLPKGSHISKIRKHMIEFISDCELKNTQKLGVKGFMFKEHLRKRALKLARSWKGNNNCWGAEVLNVSGNLFALEETDKSGANYIKQVVVNEYFRAKNVVLHTLNQNSIFSSVSKECSIKDAFIALVSSRRSSVENRTAPVAEASKLPKFIKNFINDAKKIFSSHLYELHTVRFLAQTENFVTRPHLSVHADMILYQQLSGRTVFFVFPPFLLGLVKMIEVGSDLKFFVSWLKNQRINIRQFVLGPGEVTLIMPASVYAIWVPTLETGVFCCARTLQVKVKNLDESVDPSVYRDFDGKSDTLFKDIKIDENGSSSKRNSSAMQEMYAAYKKQMLLNPKLQMNAQENGDHCLRISTKINEDTTRDLKASGEDKEDDIFSEQTEEEAKTDLREASLNSDNNASLQRCPIDVFSGISNEVMTPVKEPKREEPDPVEFKVRTITAFIQLYQDYSIEQVEDEFLAAAEFLLNAKKVAEASFEVQTLRISTNSADEWLPQTERKRDSLLHRISGICKGRVDFFSIGHVEKANITEIIETYKTLNCSMKLDEGSYTSALKAAEVVKSIGERKHLKGMGNFRFSSHSRMPPFCPFFPSSFSPSNQDTSHGREAGRWFSVGLENGNLISLVIRTLGENFKLKDFEHSFTDVYRKILTSVQEVFMRVEVSDKKFQFVGVDASLNPSLEGTGERSMGRCLSTLLKNMKNDNLAIFGDNGSTQICYSLTKSIRTAGKGLIVCGYSGLMLPVLEDHGLGKLSNSLSVQKLMQFSAVCGVGLDTIPIPGDFKTQDLAAIITDLTAISCKWDKPLSCRVLPVSGKRKGEETEFESRYLVNSNVYGLY